MSRTYRILLLSDEVDRALYDHFDQNMPTDIDLIISCGDLPARYLEYIATLTSVPLFYVRGNHDERYHEKPPMGCVCLEDDVIEYDGLRMLGLGGCVKYKEGPDQFTEKQMESRIRKLWFKLRKKKGFDVLVTHAPAKDHHDGKGAHQGFACFRSLVAKYNPAAFFYGHVHLNYKKQPRESRLGKTKTVNAFQKHIVEVTVN